jgi:hypothetical protein
MQMIRWKNGSVTHAGATICWDGPKRKRAKVFESGRGAIRGRFRSLDITQAHEIVFDATDETFAQIAHYLFTTTLRTSVERFKQLNIGHDVIVIGAHSLYKGREGRVFAIKKDAWRGKNTTRKLPKLGIAIGDDVEIATTSMGHIFVQPAERIWEWAHNCIVLNATEAETLKKLESAAYLLASKGVEKLLYDMQIAVEMSYYLVRSGTEHASSSLQ